MCTKFGLAITFPALIPKLQSTSTSHISAPSYCHDISQEPEHATTKCTPQRILHASKGSSLKLFLDSSHADAYHRLFMPSPYAIYLRKHFQPVKTFKESYQMMHARTRMSKAKETALSSICKFSSSAFTITKQC